MPEFIETDSEDQVSEEDLRQRREEHAKRMEIFNQKSTELQANLDKRYPEPDFDQMISLATVENFPSLWYKGELDDTQKVEALKKIYAYNRREYANYLLEHEEWSPVDNLLDKTMRMSESINQEPFLRYEAINKIKGFAESSQDWQDFSEFAKIWESNLASNLGGNFSKQRETLDSFATVCRYLNGHGISPRPIRREHTEELAMVDSISKVLNTIHGSGIENEAVVEIKSDVAHSPERKLMTPEKVNLLGEIFTETKDEPDQQALLRLYKSVWHYMIHHDFNEASSRGSIDRLLPALKSKDTQVDVLQKDSNVWGMTDNDYGLGDFICECYALPVKPATINRLLMIQRSIPTSNYHRLEQNREDGYKLIPGFGILRDFIHDQRPNIHQLVKAMIDYYDSKGERRAELEYALDQTDYFDRNRPENRNRVLDLNNYAIQAKDGEVEIDILRRVAINTEPIPELPPETKDSTINELVSAYQESVSKENLNKILAVINNRLKNSINENEIGIDPTLVELIAWTENTCFKNIQALNFEEQMAAFRQPWFQETIKFVDLISNSEYDEATTEAFLQEINSHSQGDWKAVYNMIGKHAIEISNRLVNIYNQEDRGDWAKAVWSGNCLHELMTLTEARKAETMVGQRMADESNSLKNNL